MPWLDLQREVLEQFCAPEWFGLAAEDAVVRGTLSAVWPGDDIKVVARKRDDDTRERILEVAGTRATWKLQDLVTKVALTDQEAAKLCGKALSETPGWRQTGAAGRQSWTDVPRVLAWLGARQEVSGDAVYRALGLAPQTLAVILRGLGWTQGGTKRAPVWSAPSIDRTSPSAEA